jgi:hypothetical protein
MAQPMAPIRSGRFVSNYNPELQQTDWNPICGYKDRNLKSLEEAVESIAESKLVENIREHAKEAKQRCTKNTRLTPNESAAIYLYTMNTPFYETLNGVLRVENPPDLVPWFDFLKLFITALTRLPSRKATVWRGITNITASNFGVDNMFTWWNVNSCSVYASVAAGFTCDMGVLFCINTINGKEISVYSSAKNGEEEVILMPGTRLRVKDKTFDVHGFSVVHLEEWLVYLKNIMKPNELMC